MLRHASFAVLLFLVASACTDLAALDGGGTAPPLAGAEQEAVREQVEKALAEKRFKTAWNQEVAAGADRARLEAIALAALEAQSGHADDMFVALRAKHETLSNGARARVDALVTTARQEGSWSRALELELMTADDPGDFARAWSVYRAAPTGVAPGLLEAIQEAKADAAEKAAAADQEGD